MFDKFTDDYTTPAIIVIFIILLAAVFVCQTIGKLVFYLIGRFNKTEYSGRGILNILNAKNGNEEAKIKEVKFNLVSSFYSYSKKKNEFVVSKNNLNKANLWSNLWVSNTATNSEEIIHHSATTRWQAICSGLLMIVPYLLFMTVMLMTFIPDGQITSSGYKIGIEAICILGWIFILICYFWWMSWVQDFNAEIEQQAKQLDNRSFYGYAKGMMKVMSYIPFSFRTII